MGKSLEEEVDSSTRREFLKRSAVLGLSFLLSKLARTTKAEPQMITFSSPEKIRKTTISQNWIAWQEENDIWYVSRNNPSTQYQLTTSGNAHHPDLDGDNLVYDENGSIMFANLKTGVKKYLYRPTTYEFCSQPKINENGVVFHVKTNPPEPPESKEEIWAYLISERRARPITNSRNSKGVPCIYWPWAVWPELVNKENSRPGLVGGDWDVLGYDLETFKEFVVDNDPNFSSDSCAIFGEKVLYILNTLPYTQGSCKTFLGAYYILKGKYRSSFEGPTGESHNLALHGNLLTWERIFEKRNIPDKIEAMVIREGISQGFRIYDYGGNQHSPDVWSDPNDPFKGIVSYVSNDVKEPQEFVISSASETKEKSILFTDKLIYDQRIGFLELLRENWLKNSQPGENFDFNKDGTFNFKDYTTLAERMFK